MNSRSLSSCSLVAISTMRAFKRWPAPSYQFLHSCGHLLRRGVCVVSLLLPLSSVAATGMTARAAVAAAVAVGPEALTTAAVYARTRLHGAADVRDQHCCGQSKEGCVHVRRSAWNAGPTQEAGCSPQENQSSAQEGRRKTSERRQSTGEFFAGRLSLPGLPCALFIQCRENSTC